MKILTIDLEDWFHILDHDATRHPRQWEKFESRVERNTEWILEQLSGTGQSATFFCLGWIAKKYPGLVRKISDAGYEIACHSMNHQLIYETTPDEFRRDLTESKKLLEDISGKSIDTYRAPGFSITPGTNWAFGIIAELGFRNDCSIFPASRNHGGYPQFGSGTPSLIQVHGAEIREFPMSLVRIAGRNLVVSGGGYFRLFPYGMIRRLLAKQDYTMTYFHPRDFDTDQPMLDTLPLRRKIMSYTGLRSSGAKFKSLLSDFRFISVHEAAEKVVWNTAASLKIG